MRRRTLIKAGGAAFTVTLLSGCSRDDGGGGGGDGTEDGDSDSGGGGGPYGMIGPGRADGGALGPVPEGDGDGE